MKRFLELWKKYSFILLLAFISLSLFDLRFAVVAVTCMAAPVIVSFFKGRFWCGNLCPRGNFYDQIIAKFSKKRKVPSFLKSRVFRGIVVVVMMTIFTIGIIKSWPNLYQIGFLFYRMIVITTIIGIFLSMFYNHRTWCHFCPMGTLSSIVSKWRKSKKVLQVSSGCVSCKLCEKKCSLGIVPYEYKGDMLSHPDCIQCGKCIIACPKNIIGYDTLVESQRKKDAVVSN